MDSKKENSFLSLSSGEEEEEESEKSEKINNMNDKDKKNEKNEQKKYNNIFNNNSNELFSNSKEKDNSDKEYILKMRDKLNNNIAKVKNKNLLILPPPENELVDKHSKENAFQDEEQENKVYIKLMNPDNMNINIIESDANNNNINNEKNIISINQKDILDQNWEIKYINKILKKDMKEALKNEEDKDEKNKMNNKKRKRDKNKNEDVDEFIEENIRSKYDKISTKKRYGW